MKRVNRPEFRSLGHRFFVMQEGREIWVVESDERPVQVSERGKASRSILHTAPTREEAEDLAKRATNGTGYELRASKR